jgi:hypothetical protein
MIITVCAGRIEFVDIFDFVAELPTEALNPARGYEYVVPTKIPYARFLNEDSDIDCSDFKKKTVKTKSLSRKDAVTGISNKLDEARLKVFICEDLIKLISNKKVDLQVSDLGIAELEQLALYSMEEFGLPTHAFVTANEKGALLVIANPEDLKVFLGSRDGKERASLVMLNPNKIKICLFKNLVIEDQVKSMGRF